MNKIESKNICEAYLKSVEKVLNDGVVVDDERGSKTYEVLNICAVIHQPVPPLKSFFGLKFNKDYLERIEVPKGTIWNGEKLQRYCEQLINQDRQGFTYTYGNRLREYFGIDQLENVVRRLEECRESRRATCVTLSPKDDAEKQEIPCLQLLDFKIRNNFLYTTAVFRSNDIYGAMFPNMVGINYISYLIADKLHCSIGTYTHHSISAHIYDPDVPAAHTLLELNNIE